MIGWKNVPVLEIAVWRPASWKGEGLYKALSKSFLIYHHRHQQRRTTPLMMVMVVIILTLSGSLGMVCLTWGAYKKYHIIVVLVSFSSKCYIKNLRVMYFFIHTHVQVTEKNNSLKLTFIFDSNCKQLSLKQ